MIKEYLLIKSTNLINIGGNMTEKITIAVITGIFTIIAAIIGIFKKSSKKGKNQTISQEQRQNVTVNNYLDGNNNDKNNFADSSALKLKLQILFIDDERFKMVENIKKAGWKNVTYKKDIFNLDDISIQNSHIIFVDINGVGQNLFPQNQGIGLAAAIKDKYPKKQVCIYSAEPHMLDPDLKKIDYTLQKNAEPIQFYNFIEEFGQKCFE